MQSSEPTSRRRIPALAALLSLLTFGLGQLYNGEPRKGVGLFVAVYGGMALVALSALLETFAGLLIFLVPAICLCLYALLDAYGGAMEKQHFVPKRYNRWYVYVVVVLAVQLVAPYTAYLFTVHAYKIPTGSMEPTLQIGDHVYVGLRSYDGNPPRRGDIIAHYFPQEPEHQFIHRIIGLPGDRIRIMEKRVYVNGEMLDEPYAVFGDFRSVNPEVDARRDNLLEIEIPSGDYFVMGDNRDVSHDSRFRGLVPHYLIIGKLLYVYWSPDWSRIGKTFR